jgi:hypothetical protein
MNRFFLVTTVCAALFFAGCQETKEEVKSPVTQQDLYKAIGEEIPFETGMAWIDFHKKKESAKGRIESLPPCKIPAEHVKAMLSSLNDLVGVAFHYAIDDFGASHILAIPVNESMQLWALVPGRVIIDANTGTEISYDLAHTWAEKYKALYPSEVWYHFFGKNIFDDMQALPYFESVDIEPATNSEELSPELLLIIWNDAQIAVGRTTALYGTVYDASNACPPCATI